MLKSQEILDLKGQNRQGPAERVDFFQSKKISPKQVKNYYRVLAVSSNADIVDIRKNYRFLVKRYHPDSTQFDKKSALEVLKAINEAYETLSDPTLRKRYDSEN